MTSGSPGRDTGVNQSVRRDASSRLHLPTASMTHFDLKLVFAAPASFLSTADAVTRRPRISLALAYETCRRRACESLWAPPQGRSLHARTERGRGSDKVGGEELEPVARFGREQACIGRAFVRPLGLYNGRLDFAARFGALARTGNR